MERTQGEHGWQLDMGNVARRPLLRTGTKMGL